MLRNDFLCALIGLPESFRRFKLANLSCYVRPKKASDKTYNSDCKFLSNNPKLLKLNLKKNF